MSFKYAFLKYEIRSAVRSLVQLCVTLNIIIIMITKLMYLESKMDQYIPTLDSEMSQ